MNRISILLMVLTLVQPSCEKNKDITGDSGTFIDSRDGHEYKWIGIGKQRWMAENLAYLPNVSPPTSGSSTDPYYYVYDYQGTDVNEAQATDNYQTYGVLYNWPAALEACPDGWHLPSDDEWKELEIFLGMSHDFIGVDDIGFRGTDQGGKLKETGTTHWLSPNTGATNSSGFTALPGGSRLSSYGIFVQIGEVGVFYHDWVEADVAGARGLYCNNPCVLRGGGPVAGGISVRCVKDD